MADAAAVAAHRAVMERVRRFQFDRFDPQTEEWIYYIRRFETELALHELRGDDNMEYRRNLLLSRIVQGSCRPFLPGGGRNAGLR